MARPRKPMALAGLIVMLALAPAAAQHKQLEMCAARHSGPGKTCLVDGDTLWLAGQNIRLKDFDTPEPHTAICGGAPEVALANRASRRLLELLNGHDWTIQYFGHDRTSSHRRLATIAIDGRDVGDILIHEHLARRWPDGDEWWCRR